MKTNIRSNFDMLRAYEAQLWRLGALAERYFAEDPNTSLLKLRQLSELLAQSLAARTPACLVCFEADYSTCHRTYVARAAHQLDGPTVTRPTTKTARPDLGYQQAA